MPLSRVTAVFLALFLMAAPAYAAAPVFHGAVDATATGAYVYVGACGTASVASGQICTISGTPSNNCTIGAVAVDVAGGNEYTCTASNTWTKLVLNGSAPAFGAITVTGITDSNATPSSCVSTNGSRVYTYGTCVSTSANNTFTGINTFQQKIVEAPSSGTDARIQLTSSGTNSAYATFDTANNQSFIHLNNDGAALPSLTNVGLIAAQTPNGNCGGATVAFISLITAGNTTHPGGAMTFHTSDDSGTCADAENLVLPADHHVYMPQDEYHTTATTPTSCTANVPCGTVTWTFTTPFHTTSGAAENPFCTSGMIEDDNNTGVTWVLSVAKAGLSNTAVTYNYTPLTATAVSTTLDIWAECHTSSY